jgi:hypothetical protein
MENVPVIHIVASSPRLEDIAKLTLWYNDVHVPMLMKYGVKSAERFKILTKNSDYPTFLGIYHYENLQGYENRQSPAATAEIAKDVQATWPNGYGIRWRVWYVEHRKWSAPGAASLGTGAVIHIVGVNGPGLGKDAEFNRWYDTTHVPWLMKTGTIMQSVRYQIIQPNKDYPAYLAVYYFENPKAFEAFSNHPERLAAIKELDEHWPNGIGRMWWVQYQMMKGWKR